MRICEFLQITMLDNFKGMCVLGVSKPPQYQVEDRAVTLPTMIQTLESSTEI